MDPLGDVLKVAVEQPKGSDDEVAAVSSPLELVNVTPKKPVATSSKQVKRLWHGTPTKLPDTKKLKAQTQSTPKQGVKCQIGAVTPQNLLIRKKNQKSRTSSSGCKSSFSMEIKVGSMLTHQKCEISILL